MKVLVASLVFASLVAFPALGQPAPPSDARDVAIRDCNANARKYTQYLWGNLEIQQYRTCMTQRSQKE